MTMACRGAPFRFPSTASQTHFLFSTLHATRLSLSANSTATTQPQLSRLGPIFMSQPAADSSAVPSSQDGAEKAEGSDVLVQYVVLRRDLIDTWPLGSVVTQGCHASVAAVWLSREDPHTIQYCSPDNIDSMHKVTLEVKGETQILNLSEKLKSGGIAHKLWIEQPENFPTCLATKPYPKSIVSSYFKKLKLFSLLHKNLNECVLGGGFIEYIEEKFMNVMTFDGRNASLGRR